MKRFLILVSIFLITLVLTSCKKKEEEEKRGEKEVAGKDVKVEKIIIGVAGPLTGSQAKMGQDVLKGVKLAVKEWNEKGGILGKEIEVVEGDDEAQENKAPSTAKQLINKGVIGVIGHFNSGCTIPASENYKDADVIMITPSATNPKVTDRGYWNVFRVCGRDDVQGFFAAEYTIKNLKAKKIAVLHDMTAYGKGLADYYKEGIEKLGGEIVLYEGFSNKDRDFRGILNKVKSAGPDVWYFGGIYDQAGPLVVQAREVGLKATFMSGDGVIDPEFLKNAGDKAEGTYLTFSPDFKELPQGKKFFENYEKEYGPAGPYSVYAYVAAQILLEAIEKTSRKEDSKIVVNTRKIAKAIRSSKHEGPMGTLEFDNKGDIKGSFYIMWKVKDGKFVVCED